MDKRLTTSPIWLAMSLLAACAVSACTGGEAAESPSPSPAAALGFAPDRLARIDAVMQEYVNAGKIAGVVTLVARNGQVAHLKAYGTADREQRVPMAVDTLVRMASTTKIATTVAVMQLMEEGRLLVTEPVSRYIPQFKNTKVAVLGEGGRYTVVPARREITIHDVLTKTSGIAYPSGPTAPLYEAEGFHQWYFADNDVPMCTMMEKLPALPFHAQPGERWFNGYTTDILGCVVEKITGQTLDEYMRMRIFEPLRMTDTYFFVPPEKAARLAVVYSARPDGTIVRAEGKWTEGQGDFVDGPRKAFSGGAGLVSTATDYARLLQMLLNGGELDGVRVLAPKTVQMITQNHVGPLYRNGDSGFGFNVEVVLEDGHDDRPGSVGTWGWQGAYFPRFWVDPQEKLVAVFLAQLLPYGGASDLHAKFQTLVYQSLVRSEGPAATTSVR